MFVGDRTGLYRCLLRVGPGPAFRLGVCPEVQSISGRVQFISA